MKKELPIDATLDPPWFLLDYAFKAVELWF
jgi:hypothetical protein